MNLSVAPRGPLDRFIRRFQRTTHLLAMLALYLVVTTVIGIALAPALALFAQAWSWAMGLPAPWCWLLSGLAAGLSLFVFGFALLVAVEFGELLRPSVFQRIRRRLVLGTRPSSGIVSLRSIHRSKDDMLECCELAMERIGWWKLL